MICITLYVHYVYVTILSMPLFSVMYVKFTLYVRYMIHVKVQCNVRYTITAWHIPVHGKVIQESKLLQNTKN